jgi:hypothetical protein
MLPGSDSNAEPEYKHGARTGWEARGFVRLHSSFTVQGLGFGLDDLVKLMLLV